MLVTFVVFRFDPETDQYSHFDHYQIETQECMNIIDGLFEIVDKHDGSIAFRYACRGAICGSCALVINGKPRLACQTMIETLESDVIKLEPLPHLEVIKDLVVDLTPLLEKLELVMPFFQSETATEHEREVLQSSQQYQVIENAVNCILCTICDSTCPIVHFKKEFLGPASLVKAYRFTFDSRDEATAERLEMVDRSQGVWGCRTIARCTEFCPKHVGPSRCISALKRKLVKGYKK